MASVTPPITRSTMSAAQQILCPICHKPNLRRTKFCQWCGKDVVLNNDGPRYYITRIIKEGGQGAVYETIGDDGKVYAVKEMLDRFTDPKERDEALERFEHEAALLRSLDHPRIPKVYTDFKDEGRQYLAMEYVRGEDLEEAIKRQRTIPEPQALKWADQICDVLDYLHNHKAEPIIFRDMKPSNVMIEPNGNIKLVDFGIAKVFQHAQRGTQIGTPGYAPPEQYQGLATPASDIYALGATLHHMLTGRDPRDEPPFSFPPAYGLNPRISRRTSDAIQKALQMKPEDRFQSIAEFRAALNPPQVRVAPGTAARAGQPQVAAPAARPAAPPITARPVPAPAAVPAAAQPAPAPVARPQPVAPAQPPRRRGGFLRGLLALVLVVVLAGFIAYVAFPDLVGQYVPGLGGTTTQPTAQQRVFVPKNFRIVNQEVIVPHGQDVTKVYQDAFVTIAQADPQYGPEAKINPNAPPAFVGTPENLGEDPQGRGTLYRATMEGLIYVPE